MEFSLEAIIREPLVALHHIFASHARELPRVENDDLGMTAQFKQLLQKLDCHVRSCITLDSWCYRSSH
jgi:hypothetical protein